MKKKQIYIEFDSLNYLYVNCLLNSILKITIIKVA